MSVATLRATFKEYCLRKLSKPVIEIDVDDDQVDDRVWLETNSEFVKNE